MDTKSENLRIRCHFTTNRLSVNSWGEMFISEEQQEELLHSVIHILSKKVTKHLPPDWQDLDDREKASIWINDRNEESDAFTIKLTDTNEIVGLLLLTEIGDQTTLADLRLGFFLSEQFWGKGIASELISGLVEWCRQDGGVRSIAGGVEDENVASARVLEKNGFSISAAEIYDNVKIYELVF